MSTQRAKFVFLTCCAGAALLSAAPSHAQDQAAAEAQPGTATADEQSSDIVVTAQKREQSLQDVSVSVTALGADAIESLGRQDVTALANQVPNLQTNQYAPTVTVFNIRGISQNDFADQQEAPIAFYNDEVYVGALGAISGQTFDIERIEVLRGPQGTLFGRNATGGLIQILTADPSPQLEGFATVTAGSYGQIATEGAIGGPLSDGVRARLSATTNHHGGYIENRIGPDLGASRFFGGRLQVEADVGQAGTLLIKLQGLRNDNERSGGLYTHAATGFDEDGLGFRLRSDEDFWGTGPGNDAVGYRDEDDDPYEGSYDHVGRFDRKYWSATARYEHDFGNIDFVSLTDYQSLDKRYSEDADVSPEDVFVYSTAQDLYQLSQEFRLTGTADKLTWIAGVYGLKIRSDNDYQVDLSESLGLLNDYGGRQTTGAVALFGQAEYAFNDFVSLIAGARYTWDTKKYDFHHVQRDVLGGTTDVFDFNTTTDPDLAKLTSNDYSGKIQVDVRPTENVLVYAGISRGTKGGGFGVQAFQPINPATLPFEKEVLTSYEAGTKLTLADRKLYLNGSAFYYDYDGYQAFSILDLSQFITNKRARVLGFEIDLYARPLTGLKVNAFVSHLNTKVYDIALPFGRIVDRKMPQAPSFSVGGSIDYDVDLGAGSLGLHTDWKYNSAQYFSTFNAPIDREKAYVVGNARVSYALESPGLEFAVFVNNLTDKEYRLYNLDLSTALGLSQQTYARPRWFGASVGYRY